MYLKYKSIIASKDDDNSKIASALLFTSILLDSATAKYKRLISRNKETERR